MGEQPQTENKAAGFVVQVIKILMSVGEEAATAFICLELPFLANPIGRRIVKWLLTTLGDVLQSVVIKAAVNVTIDIQIHGERSDVMSAATQLKYAQGSGNAEAIAKAKERLSKSWGNAIHWDGIVSTK